MRLVAFFCAMQCCSPGRCLKSCWYFHLCRNPEEVGFITSPSNRLHEQPGRVRAGRGKKHNFLLSCVCQHEVWPMFREGLPASNNLMKRLLTRVPSSLEFLLVSGAVKVIPKISHHDSQTLDLPDNFTYVYVLGFPLLWRDTMTKATLTKQNI